MFRKLIIALGATAALTATVSSASAWHSHHHNHGWGAFGAGVALGALATPVVAGYPYGYASNCYVVKRWVDTSYGPRLRRVTVCD
jgi:hypothetical protein